VPFVVFTLPARTAAAVVIAARRGCMVGFADAPAEIAESLNRLECRGGDQTHTPSPL
jgi:hypothetical protein